MPKFRRKPVVIEARQYDGENASALVEWVEDTEHCFTPAAVLPDGALVIVTLEGEMTVSPGAWVIRGTSNEFYPCKPDVFPAIYESVED